MLFHEVKSCFLPVMLLYEILAPGNQVLAGKSKLCQMGSVEFDPFRNTKFPSSRRTAITGFELEEIEGEEEEEEELSPVDQIGDFDSFNKTKLPSMIFNSDVNLSETGVSLFATQAIVLVETFLYHIPM